MWFFSHVSWFLVIQAPDVEVDKTEFLRSLPTNSSWASLASMEFSARCSCPAYFHFISTPPEFNLKALTPAPNQSYLWFGPSFLGEILENVVMANRIQGLELSHEKDKHYHVADDIRKARSFGTIFYRNGASITGVINVAALMGANSSQRLHDFILAMNFSIAIFMEPHRKCFFEEDLRRRCWIDTVSPFKPPRRYEVSETLPILTSVVPFVVEVVPWTGEKAGVYHSHRHNLTHFVNLAKYGGQCSSDEEGCCTRGAKPPKRVNRSIAKEDCCKEGCCTRELGHQCNPGALSLFAVELMNTEGL